MIAASGDDGASSGRGPCYSARTVERGEKPSEEGFHATVGGLLGRDQAGDIALGDERGDQVGIARQHMDRDGPWRLGPATDNGRRLVIAEQDDEPVTGHV